MSTATCSVYNCGNIYGGEGVTFHRFPIDKPTVLTQWLDAIGKTSWLPGKDDYLCSEHFSGDMFNEKNGYRFMKPDAVPTRFYSLPRARALFPPGTPFRFLSVKEIEDASCRGYVIEAKLDIDSEETFSDWLKNHEAVAVVQYKTQTAQPVKLPKNLCFKAEYICRNKLSNCPAKLNVRIRSRNASPKSSNPLDENGGYLCTVILYHLHNHRVESNVFGAVSRSRLESTMSDEMQQKLLEIFKGGYTSEDALALHQQDVIEAHPDNFEPLLFDQDVCPALGTIHEFYQKFIDSHGDWSKDYIFELLEKEMERIRTYGGKVELKKMNENIVIALCTPLMQRAHTLKTSAESVFCDHSGLMWGCKSYIYILMTYSGSEGLPLGIVITTSDDDEYVRTGFEMLAGILPGKAFGQYGRTGPEIFFAALNSPEARALRHTYPDSTTLICCYKLITSLWCWIWDSSNKINEEDCSLLYSLVLGVLKTKESEELETLLQNVLNNITVLKYPEFVSKLKEIHGLSSKWAMVFKNEFSERHNGISALEMSSLVLRDPMYKGKAYNLVQRLHVISLEVETYLKQKINHCINNTMDKFLPASFQSEVRTSGLEVHVLSTGQFKVLNPSTNKAYYVDMEACMCTCPIGLRGCRCQHQYAVTTSRVVDISHSFPNDDSIKQDLHWIATNNSNRWASRMNVVRVKAGGRDSDDMDDEEYDPDCQAQQKFRNRKSTTPRDEAKAILERVTRDIMIRYETNPSEYHKAIVALAVKYQSLQHDHTIIRALRNFGKED